MKAYFLRTGAPRRLSDKPFAAPPTKTGPHEVYVDYSYEHSKRVRKGDPVITFGGNGSLVALLIAIGDMTPMGEGDTVDATLRCHCVYVPSTTVNIAADIEHFVKQSKQYGLHPV